MDGYWTNDRVEVLKDLVAKQELSYSQIAQVLGDGATRNSVLSKALRMKLPGTEGRNTYVRQLGNARSLPPKSKKHGNSNVPKVKEMVARAEKRAAAIADPIPDIRDEDIPVEQRLTLLQLTERTCKWSIGTPGRPDFHFCGAEKPFDVKTPYCARHQQRATNRIV